MSDDADRRAQQGIADALAKSFEEWANLPETRKLIRESVAGRVKRRSLMKAAHATGVRDGASIYKATIAMMLGRALGRPADTDVESMLADVDRLKRAAAQEQASATAVGSDVRLGHEAET